MIQPILTSALEKYARAQHHFGCLLAQVEPFFDSKPYKTRTEPNADFTKYRLYVEFDSPMPSGEWGLMFGDGVHNLRSALDHCVYAIGAKENNGWEPPPKWNRLQFPITEDSDKWNEQAWRLETLSDPAQAAIKLLQPHGNTQEFVRRPLGALSEFDNADKHRSIRVVAGAITDNEGLLSGLIPGEHVRMKWRNGPLKDGTPFLTVSLLGRPNPNVKMTDKLTIQPVVPYLRPNRREVFFFLRPCIDAMNEAATKVMYELAPFF